MILAIRCSRNREYHMNFSMVGRLFRLKRSDSVLAEDKIKDHKRRLHADISKINNDLRMYSRERKQLQQKSEDFKLANELDEHREALNRLKRLHARIARLRSVRIFLERNVDLLTDAEIGIRIGEIAESGTNVFNELGFNSSRLEKSISDLGIASEMLKSQVEQSLEEGLEFMTQQTNDIDIEDMDTLILPSTSTLEADSDEHIESPPAAQERRKPTLE